jgi:hypothetical protein
MNVHKTIDIYASLIGNILRKTKVQLRKYINESTFEANYGII